LLSSEGGTVTDGESSQRQLVVFLSCDAAESLNMTDDLVAVAQLCVCACVCVCLCAYVCVCVCMCVCVLIAHHQKSDHNARLHNMHDLFSLRLRA